MQSSFETRGPQLEQSEVGVKIFKNIIWDYYSNHARAFAWRHVDDPYKVFVSEVMLQQTQTARVIDKFAEFMARFPTIENFAHADFFDVLQAWQGLGYNRRGKFLHQAAQKIVSQMDGKIPDSPDILKTLPGIGPATAASICAFAFNKPTIFIETNIRAVFIHFFFHNETTKISDAQLFPLVEQTVDHDRARDWYYALMDYGVMLKKALPNPSRKSKHHTRQSKFEGSDRQIRGMILKLLIQEKSVSIDRLFLAIDREPERINKALSELVDEKMVQIKQGTIFV